MSNDLKERIKKAKKLILDKENRMNKDNKEHYVNLAEEVVCILTTENVSVANAKYILYLAEQIIERIDIH